MKTFDTKLGRFYLGECLETMASFPDGVFDMVLCDLPYGTTAVACENLDRRWVCIEREEEYFNKAVARLK